MSKIDALRSTFDVVQYGALSFDSEKYPVFAVKSKSWNAAKRTVLVTGNTTLNFIV